MRAVAMEEAQHAALLAKLVDERKRAQDCVRIFERNEANGWKGIPPINRRSAQERLPGLHRTIAETTGWIDALSAATLN